MLTSLAEYRRQQLVKKQISLLEQQLQAQHSKQGQAWASLRTLLVEHKHDEYALKAQLPKLPEVPKPYVHPLGGVCSQKPQAHRHSGKDIVGLKVSDYGFEQLKRDHPKLCEPFLHEPRRHMHVASEIREKIQPWQVETTGLDADTVDGQHAKDLIAEISKKLKRVRVSVGGGGGADGSMPHVGSHAKGGSDAFDGAQEILLRLENHPVDPADPEAGRVYFNTTSNRVRIYVPA